MMGTPKHLVRGKSLSEWARILGLPYSTTHLYYRNGTLESRIDGTYKAPPPPDKTKHFVRGKSVKEWAAILGIKLCTAWKRFQAGTLEIYIIGETPDRTTRYFGLTIPEIQERLGKSAGTIYKYLRDGTLERRLAGEVIPGNYNRPVIIDGMTTADCRKALGGITRERVRQLKKRGLLQDRLNGVDTTKRGVEKRRKKVAERREQLRKQRLPGESGKQLARRIGMIPETVRKAFPDKVPFAAERRELRTRTNEAIASQRRPGESVMQFAKRIGMDHNVVRRACGGKVPFAAERRAIEAQRILKEATNGQKD